ncbi:MAG: ABC transporter permease [Cytophagales bacterium]|nr:ABC transporter permease [Cytophagales bacterium]
MLLFNLKLIFRNLYKNRLYTFVNVAGLSVALAVCLYTGLWVYHESTYDRFHKDGEQIYRVEFIVDSKNGRFEGIASEVPFASALEASYAGVTDYVRVDYSLVSATCDKITVDEVLAVEADSSFFGFFTFPLLKGSPRTVLNSKHKVAISERLAFKLFGDSREVVGKSILLDHEHEYIISGLFKTPPSRTHLYRFDLVRLIENKSHNHWWSTSVFSYFKIPDAGEMRRIESELRKFVAQQIVETHNWDYESAMNKHLKDRVYFFHPLSELNLGNDYRTRVLVFVSAAVLILLLAVSNYVSMSVSRYRLRTKEIGLRKVMGASRKHVLGLYFTEALVFSLTASCLALVVLELLYPFLNSVIDVPINIYEYEPEWIYGGILCCALLISCASAVFPFFYFTNLTPRELLGKRAHSGGNSRTQKGAVVFQFSIALGLLICIAVIARQMYFVNHRDFGYSPDRIIHLQLKGKEQLSNAQVFVNELRKSSSVGNACLVSDEINRINMRTSFIEKSAPDEFIRVSIWEVQQGFADLYQLSVLEEKTGVEYSSRTVVYVSERFFKESRWASIEGKVLVNYGKEEFPVVGVLSDFVFSSIYRKPEPLVVLVYPDEEIAKEMREFQTVAVSMKTGSAFMETLGQVKAAWKRLFPFDPINFTTVSESIIRQHQREFRFQKLVAVYAVLSVCLALVGLFALSAYTAEQRTKEVGVRKTYGAGLREIFNMLFWDLSKLVGWSAVLAFPVAYYCMNKWLEQFAYTIELSPVIFLLSFLIVWLVAGLTVSYHSLQVARVNPVEALRDE